MIENGPILWAACTTSAAVAVYFVKIWINRLARDLEKMEAKLEGKLDKILCDERNSKLEISCDKLWKHKHAGTGEVILP